MMTSEEMDHERQQLTNHHIFFYVFEHYLTVMITIQMT